METEYARRAPYAESPATLLTRLAHALGLGSVRVAADAPWLLLVCERDGHFTGAAGACGLAATDELGILVEVRPLSRFPSWQRDARWRAADALGTHDMLVRPATAARRLGPSLHDAGHAPPSR